MWQRPGLRWALLGALAAVIVGCSLSKIPAERDGPGDGRDVSQVPDAVPRVEPLSRGGNPTSYVVFGKRYYPMRDSRGYQERGIASWYGRKFHGNKTSNGETYDMYTMTAAHKRLPLPTFVEVTNLENGRRVVVRVNDRGPFHDNRIIDLSYAAASRIGMLGKGTALVEVRAIDPSAPASTAPPGPKAAKTSSSHSPRIYLQAGAFGVSDNAQRLQGRLERELARSVRVVPHDSPQGRVHRVQVGPLASVEVADRVVADMQRLGVVKPVVVID